MREGATEMEEEKTKEDQMFNQESTGWENAAHQHRQF